MKFFRSHITKTPGVITLLLGFLLHFAQPVQKTAHQNAFTSWLDGHLKADEENDLRKQLRELGSEDEELEQLIRKASEVVAEHTDDFELPFSSSDKDQVFDLLITEWNAYQNSSTGMGEAVILESSKSGAIQQDSKVLNKSISTASSAGSASEQRVLQNRNRAFHISTASPLQSGIAINAP